MTTSHSAQQLSSRLFAHPPMICLRCQHRLSSRPLLPTAIPKLPRRWASDSTARKWSQRFWKRPESQPANSQENGEAAIGTAIAEEDLRRQEEGYEPATTWHGLPSIGGNQSLDWERDHVWEGFMSTIQLQSVPDISAAIHRALVEVFTLQNAGQDFVVRNPVGDKRGIEALSGATLSQRKDGAVKVAYASEESRVEIITALTTQLVEAPNLAHEAGSTIVDEAGIATEVETGVTEPENAATEGAQPTRGARVEDEDVFWPEEQRIDTAIETQTAQPPSPKKGPAKRAAWPALSDAVPVEQRIKITFPDPNLKFAIIKRVMQLTGRRIPDPAIQDINSTNALYDQLVAKPKPKKLAERLTLNEQLVESPNVQLRDRRWTPIDKEKEVGRWKVIEKELRARDLPVTGHA